MNDFHCDTFIDSLAYISIIEDWKSKSYNIVFTNGCFDILHAGHIQYLQEARQLGDKLVIGINSDASVSRLKGPQRPVNKLEDRAKLLASLRMVDLVISFDDDTPLALIEELEPGVLVKGGDYSLAEMIGSDLVLAAGGIVKVLNFKAGYSTSSIINNFRREKDAIQNENK